MRDCRILHLLVLTISSMLPPADSLSGPHVCTRLENHTLTIRETYTEPVIVQTFTWCWQVPPRCSKTRRDNRERHRIKTTIEERRITECCDGYVLQKLHSDSDADPKCIPFCKSCENGLCLKPNVCQCKPGYQGDNCAHACPPGSWGRECMEECDCALGESCNPVSGICECPAGWQGSGCKVPCGKGRWGARCESICECGGHYGVCDPETGDCRVGKNGGAEVTLSRNWTGGDLFQAVQVSGLSAQTSPPITARTERTIASTETTDLREEESPSTPESEGFSVARISETTEHAGEDGLQTVSEASDEFDVINPGFPLQDLAESKSTTGFDDSTQFEDIISSQTAPDTRRTIAPRLSEELFYRNDGNNDVDSGGIKTIGQPHPSYVKTVQKEQVPQIPYDATVLIVVASVVSLCLTTLAALMVFYLRSKAFESIPMSIYSNDKGDVGQEKGNTMRSLNITNTTLPPLPTFVNPVFAPNPENALITFDAMELNKHYDNRTGTISIRVSGNIRDLLESHYDRPPAATCRHTVDQDAEHVYDEIPLTVPLCVRKDA